MNSIHHSSTIFNYLDKLGLTFIIPKSAVKHIISIMLSVFFTAYKGKTINFSKCSNNCRTTIAHFLNNGKWNSDALRTALKQCVIKTIYAEALKTGKPIFLIVDDTIASHTKPSSKAVHPIEGAYYHQSHLKGRQDYGHQAVGVMLSCNGITLNYDVVLYDKSKSKIDTVRSIVEELPMPPVISYFLCDSWYTSSKLMDFIVQKGFHTIGALKTNRLIYPSGVNINIKEFSKLIHKKDDNVSLVTVYKREFYVYRYEGKLNGIGNAVVLICYPKDEFFNEDETFSNEKAIRAFICTNTELSTAEILQSYTVRWEIEVFFRDSKQKLALDKYQIRKSVGIKRYWLIVSLLHFICCTCVEDQYCSFNEGYHKLANILKIENLQNVYNYAQSGISFNEFYKAVA